MREKMWGVLVHLGMNMWNYLPTYESLEFDDNTWERFLHECQSAGLNTVVMDLGEGVLYKSHPEISAKGAWTHQKVKEEIERCRSFGIKLIPKLNFSASHDKWLGEYERMLSTPQYYKVCKDLILEVCELFEKPEYFHLGLDEEDFEHQNVERGFNVVNLRNAGQLLYDIKFLFDCVREGGSKPMCWDSVYVKTAGGPQIFRENIDRDAAINLGYYNALRDEHKQSIYDRQITIDYYKQPQYQGMNIQYVEDDPTWVITREQMKPMLDDGYKVLACASTCNKCKYNTMDLVEYYKNNAPDELFLGCITAPWEITMTDKNFDRYKESIDLLKEAKNMFY